MLFLLLTLFLGSVTKAATYNFYFNNTEQGANSTASPSVTVEDGKPQSTSTSTDTSTGTSPPQPSVPESNTLTEQVETSSDSVNTFPDAKWKLSLGRLSSKNTYKGSRVDSSNYNDNSTCNRQFVCATGALFYYPRSEFGVGFRAGRLIGPEIEVNPFRVRTGWGRAQFGVNAALLKDTVGFTTYENINKSSGSMISSVPNFGFESSPMPVLAAKTVKPVNLYLGAQAGINIIRDLSLNFTYRVAPLDRYDYAQSTTEWSLNYLF